MNTQKKVAGYPFDVMRHKEELILKTYEYDLPFNYPNIEVWRKGYDGGEFHGMELSTRNRISQVKLKDAEAGKWTRLRITTKVMPVADKGMLWLWLCDFAKGAVVCIANAFAGYVPDDWDENADIPAGTANLIKNPIFAGNSKSPDNWGTKMYIEPVLNHYNKDDAGREGIQIEQISADLFTEFSIVPGKRIVMEVWVKSNMSNPGTVLLLDRWINKDGVRIPDTAPDCIIIEEEEPIVRVAVIGSACTPPGFVAIEAQPCEEFYRRGDMVRSSAPVRFRQNNLWGMHLRYDQWSAQMPQNESFEQLPHDLIRRYSFMSETKVKSHYMQFPMTGMSSAIFEIPKSKRIIITGGSEIPAWTSDSYSDDDHYSFRTIRTTVCQKAK